MSGFKNSPWFAALPGVLIVLAMLGALFFNSRWLKLVLLLSAAAIALPIIWGQARKVQTEFWCYFLYSFGIVGGVMGFYPLPEMLRQGGTPEENSPLTFLLALALGFLSLGGVLHAVLFLQGRAGNEVPWKRGMLLLASIIAGTLLFVSLERRGFSHWLLYIPLALLGGVLLAVAWFVLAVRRLPVNRMARLLTAQRYREAVQLGESFAADQREPGLQFNLATAYELMGDTVKAKAVFELLKSRSDLPAQMAEELNQRLAKLDGIKQTQAS